MLAKKLHLKPGMRIAVANAPAGFSLGALPPGVTQEKSLGRDLDLVLLFATTVRELKSCWPKALGATKPDGAVWVSYPKKSSGIPTDLSMGDWEVTRNTGWAPVSMIGVDDAWSAVRFKHAPGLQQARGARQDEAVRDADGRVCVDRKNRIVTAPSDLEKRFADRPKARRAFDALSFTHRKEYVVWILDAKKPETRAARLTKTIAMLASGKRNPFEK